MKPPTPSADTPRAGRWRIVLAAVAIALAALAAYRSSFAGAFVLDDEPAILGNSTIRQLWHSWRPPVDSAVGGRPVANFSLAVNHALSGTHAWSYHAVNLLIHLLAGLTLFGIVRRTVSGNPSLIVKKSVSPATGPTAFAFGTALLWILHPLQTEAVTYVAQRVESLMGLFFLLTLYCFMRGADITTEHTDATEKTDFGGKRLLHQGEHIGTRRNLLSTLCGGNAWFVLSVISCLLGMGTKEVMATAPVLVLLYDRTFVAGSFRRAWVKRRRIHLALMATWLPLAALVAGAGWNRGGTAGFDVGVHAWAYWLTQFEAAARYLRLSLWPHPLVFDYKTFWIRHPAEVVPQAVLVLALAGTTLWALRRRPAAGFLGAWFFVILAPTSVVPGTIQMVVEHRMYLPLAAIAVAAVAAAHRWLGRWSLAAILALAAGLGWISANRNEAYRSDRALWSDTIAKCPDSDRAHNNLGNALLKAGAAGEAIEHYQEALRLNPDAADTHYNLAGAWQRTGQLQEAIAEYGRALQANPRMADAHTALGTALEAAGRSDEAASHYEQALQVDPGYANAHNNLGLMLADAGRLPEAIAHYQQALRINASLPDVHNNLANALRAAGRIPEAIEHYAQALKLRPHFAAAHNNLGNAFRDSGRLPEAAAQYEQALQAQPGVPQVHNNLGTVLLMTEHAQEAIAQFEQALRLDPNLAQVHLNLAIALESVGRQADAAVHYETARRLGLAVQRPGD